MHEITLRAMQFHAVVGVLAHERDLPQPLEIDLTVRVEDGDDIIDYRALYGLATAVVAKESLYLEQIGELIAVAALAHHPRIRGVRVAVRKPHVALPGPLAYAEVVVAKSADD